MKALTIALLSSLGLCLSLPAATTFLPITGVTSATSGSDFFPASRLIEGPGTGFDANAPYDRTSTLTWVTNAPNGGAGDYFGPTPTPNPLLTFDLGASVRLNEISFWGYADTNANGAKNVDVRFSNTPTFSGPATSLVLTQPVTPRQNFFLGEITARYIEVVPTDNFFGINPPGGDRVGLGEVAFSFVPEPSRSLLVLMGASICLIRRRR